MDKIVDSSLLQEALDKQYHCLIIDSPSDDLEAFINATLYQFAQDLKKDNLRSTHIKLKLDSILPMSKDEFFALAVSDMQKRRLPIPSQYNHLKTQNETDANRDIIISPRRLRNKIIAYGLPYTVIVFIAGIVVSYTFFNN